MTSATVPTPSLTHDTLRETCTHCGLDVPRGLIEPGATAQFCCSGCRTAYEIIHTCGLDRYYRVLEESSTTPTAVRSSRRRFAEMDDPSFASLYVRRLAGGRASVELFLEGIHCAACVWLVERLPAIVPGVVEARLDPRRALVRVTWDVASVPLSTIARTLDSLGYIPHPAREGGARDARRLDDRRMFIRLAVAGACAGNVMLLALALYAGVFDSMEAEYRHLFRWVSMGLSVLSLAWPGAVFFRGAWAAIRTRAMHLDLPIALALAAGGIWGVVNTVRGVGEVYFDTLSVLVFVLLIGRVVQQRQQRWAADSVELLFSLTPACARRIDQTGVTEVPTEALRPGDRVEVLAGDTVPADGVVLSGSSTIDQAILTGESAPVGVEPGSGIAAGAVNLSSPITIRVEATGESTRVGRLMRLVEEGTRRRAPIVRLADRVSVWFVAGMLTLAGATAAIWAASDPDAAIEHAVALLVVTCPCALGLATPLAMTVAIGRAARRGILIKGGDVVESLSRPGVIFLDKTGTLTHGRFRVVRWFGDDLARPLAAALERNASHPLARALVEDVRQDTPHDVLDIRHTLGGGVEGTVDGRAIAVGSPSFVRSIVHHEDPGLRDAQAWCLDHGHTPLLVAVDGRIVALAAMGDSIREDSLPAVRSLRDRGWDVRLLSGDHPNVVEGVARSLGITNARGGAGPEAKLAAVSEAAKSAPTVMVGDGVNDAAALAAASVGIAVHGGAEASLAAADVYLSSPGVGAISDLLTASERTLQVIRLCLGISLAYNVSAAALAMAGMLTPIIAAIVMPLSSLTVLTLVYRARTFGSEPCR